MEDIKEKNGNSWKAERYFSSYEEADTLRKAIKSKDRSNMWEVKVKRCGVNGTMFVVKSRMSETAKAELEEIQEKMLSKNKKNKK